MCSGSRLQVYLLISDFMLVVLQLSHLGVRDNVIAGTIPDSWSNLTQVGIRTTACLLATMCNTRCSTVEQRVHVQLSTHVSTAA